MGQPPRLDVWACAQGNVQWWCQFEVLEEHVCARYVPAYKTDEAGTESVGAGGASEARWRVSKVAGKRWRMSMRGDVAGRRP